MEAPGQGVKLKPIRNGGNEFTDGELSVFCHVQ